MGVAPLRKMILISDVISLEQQRQFIAWLGEVGMGWSHWMSGGWLLNAYPNQPDVNVVLQNFLRVAPNTPAMVFDVDVKHWTGWALNSHLSFAANWLQDQWGLATAVTSQPALPRRQP